MAQVESSRFESLIDGLVVAPWKLAAPEVVYHYTSREAFAQIVKTQTFWARAHYSMKDPQELDAAGDHICRAARELLDQSHGGPQRILEMFLSNYGDHKITKLFVAFLVCFSAARDKASQWAQYGTGGQGVCIGVRVPDENVDLDKSGTVGRALLAVDYDSGSWTARVQTAFERICHALTAIERTKGSQLLHDARGDALSGLFRVAAFAETVAKRSEFASEEEWRLVALAQKGYPTCRYPKPRGGDFIPLRLRATGRLLALDEIILGPNLEPDDAKRWVQQVLEDAGYPHASAEMPRINSSACTAL